MIKGITKVFLFTVLFFLFLWGFNYIVDKGLRKSQMQYYAVWNDMYASRINADVLILGNSRAKLILSPKVIDSVFHTNSYNLGINGAFFPIQDAMFKAYLQHNKKPKYIIQSVDFTMLSRGNNLSNADQYIPYINDTLVRSMASAYPEKFTTAERYLPLFKYNNHPHLIKEGIFCYFNLHPRGANMLYKGFGGSYGQFNDFFDARVKTDAEYVRNNVDKNVEAEFVAYLEYCKANDIKLIFIYEPILHPINEYFKPDSSMVTRKLMYYAGQYHIPYISYLDDSICDHKELFNDHIHLNSVGAQLFTEKLAADISKNKWLEQ
jgi:hypothetical protein